MKSYNDKYLFTASKEGGIVKWEIQSNGQPKLIASVKSSYRDLLKSKNKSNKSSGSTARGHKTVINALAVAYDGSFLASGDDDNLIFIWRADKERLEFVKIFRGHRGPITGLTFAKNKRVLYSCSADRSVKTWDLNQMGYVETL